MQTTDAGKPEAEAATRTFSDDYVNELFGENCGMGWRLDSIAEILDEADVIDGLTDEDIEKIRALATGDFSKSTPPANESAAGEWIPTNKPPGDTDAN